MTENQEGATVPDLTREPAGPRHAATGVIGALASIGLTFWGLVGVSNVDRSGDLLGAFLLPSLLSIAVMGGCRAALGSLRPRFLWGLAGCGLGVLLVRGVLAAVRLGF